MKKINRYIAMATGLALAAGMAGSLNADAFGTFYYDINSYYNSDEFEEYDDNGELNGFFFYIRKRLVN